ncbi:cation-translocating P-type ATPase [Streptococcus sp. DD12]|uniref:cation-translocating P-type ATPase n=1 Tax=Streptococcus sp. DD12 TaxID=1777880 RepID=UPI00079974AD|nr:cation-translocating P-type ATPase [Streptococcus sp. DD12]KXT75492.1 hypothetical protein STRDD12_01303 [Streptococcus sp. DD12]
MTKKIYQGLTQAQVNHRLDQGAINRFSADTSTSTWQIIKRNVFTLFNALNFAIALALAAVQAWSNLVFFAVICFNAVSGIITELRAKHMIDKLNLMSREDITVIREGEEIQIDPQDLVLDDVIILSAGEQIPSDATVLTGICEANEAMLTGESDLVLKESGDELLSGSFLSSGRVYAQVIRVGENNYANQLMLEAKTLKPIQSEILDSLNSISRVTGRIIIPFGLILLLEALLMKQLPLKDSVVTTATPLLGMLPKGIALLTVTSLLTAVIKLGMRKVLVQEMYSVETLARVDTLCLDKTGTITQGKMTVEAMTPLTDDFGQKRLEHLLATYMANSDDSNPTAKAIRKAYQETKDDYKVGHIIPFSSDRKWGAMEMAPVGSLFLGAPEMLLSENPPAVSQAQARGSRVLVLAQSHQGLDPHHSQLPADIRAIAVLEITDPIREGAADTLNYLRSQDIDLKIISGDNPVTVSHIAQQAGFDQATSYLDCSKVTDEELVASCEKTAIFGRVSPHQKKLLVQTLKAKGRTTAMTGDGVNDILALREADCSIVMAEGDPATRQIANLVLLNSDFNDVPEILFEGRRVINNIGRIAPIFFIKTIYSFLLAIICMASALFFKADWLLIFPFIPIQITLIDQFVEGFPPFVLTFERNIKPVEKHFLKRSLLLALPSAIMIVLSVILVTIWGNLQGWSTIDMATLSYYLLGTISFLSVIRACLPLNLWRAGLILFSVVGFYSSAFILRNLIGVSTLNATTLPLYTVLMVIFVIVFIGCSKAQKYQFD